MPPEDILNKLNSEQKAAVSETEGPIIILAGAGSGKTRVLVYKVLYLILEKKIKPSNILMVTFTNKAAGEMIERIKKILVAKNISFSGNQGPTIGTFHSICSRILRIDGKEIGIQSNFIIYDTKDQQELVKKAMGLLDIPIKNIRPKGVIDTISQAKNEMINPQLYTSYARGFFQESVARIYPLYQKLLRDHNALDFDDLLLETIRLFKSSSDILKKYQDKFSYILVDEYQDTNHAQYELTKLIAGKRKNISIVGDFSQSIYSFRGADFRNLEKFKNDFNNAKVFQLSQNYRSTQKILDAAHSVISKNVSHPILSLWTENNGGEDIVIFEAENEHHEAEFIIQKAIQEKSANPTLSLKDIAVLYRTNAQSRTLEEVFLHNAIPYMLVGGTRFYERKEIKDVLSFLSFLANQKDDISLKRIAKIGKRKLNAFLEYLSEFQKNNYIEKKETIDILDEVITKTSYLSLYDENDPDEIQRLENIKELRSVAIEFPNLVQFLENVALVEQEYLPDNPIKDEEPDAITLMTLHAAKGLEFKTVFMVGMEEGLFPHSQSLFDQNDIEEERRLCYVGITRAKQKLFLTYSKRRLIFGQRTENTPSRFIYELPQEVLEKNYIDRYDESQFL